MCREWKIVIETELIELAFHNYVILDATLMKTRLITAHISSTLLVNGIWRVILYFIHSDATILFHYRIYLSVHDVLFSGSAYV